MDLVTTLRRECALIMLFLIRDFKAEIQLFADFI